MEIIHVVEAFGGGIIEFIKLLTKGMPQHHHTIFYAQREINIDNIKQTFPQNVNFKLWKHAQKSISPVKDYRALITFRKYIRENNFDIIHLHSSKAGILGRIAFMLRKNTQHIIYTPNGASFARQDISSLKQKFYVLIEKLASKSAGQVVGVSKSEAEAYQQIGIKAQWINNGTPIKDTNREEFNRSPQVLKILTVGRITIQKNPQLFNNIAQAFEDNPRVKFYWVGNGELQHLLTSKNITITDWLPKEEVQQMLRTASLYISTASWEGLPFAVLEAMNYHLPLLLSQSIGNVDLIENNGYIFEHKEQAIQHINNYLNKPELLIQQGIESFQFLKAHFSAQMMASSYEKLYQSLIKTKKTSQFSQ